MSTHEQHEQDQPAAAARRASRGGPSELTAREREEAAFDREVLLWVGRFRFVTAEVLAARFDRSVQAMRKRVRRLEASGMLRRAPGRPGQHYAIYLAPAGARHVGARRHARPRPDNHAAHETALSELVCELELAAPVGIRIYTERDCRDLEAHGQGRYSVDINDGRGRIAKRWPDAVIFHPERTMAVEVEFSPKSSARLIGIIDGYLASGMHEVRFLVNDATLAARLSGIAQQQAAGIAAFNPDVCAVTIHPWQGVDQQTATAIKASVQA